jgi:hypothetical protein
LTPFGQRLIEAYRQGNGFSTHRRQALAGCAAASIRYPQARLNPNGGQLEGAASTQFLMKAFF